MIDGSKRRYTDEPVHLVGARVDEPLHIPTAEEYYAITGRRLIAEDYYQYFEDTPFNLEDGPGPAVLGSFTWSNLWVDNIATVDISAYFKTAQIANELGYNAWRIRGMWRSGWTSIYYTNPSTPVDTLVSSVQGNQAFNPVAGGWALGLGGGNLIVQSGGNYYWTGGNQDLYFPIKFQVEVGYGNPLDGVNNPAATLNWPRFSSGIGTDGLAYRGYNPNWACFNGYANAPNVVALGGCPYTGQGGYTAPDLPEDI